MKVRSQKITQYIISAPPEEKNKVEEFIEEKELSVIHSGRPKGTKILVWIAQEKKKLDVESG